MRKLTILFAALTLCAGLFATPASVPTVTDVTSAGYDVTKRVIVLYFDEEVCNDIVWAGTYNGWVIDSPTELLHFEALEGFEGWYALELDDASNSCAGRPIQLKKDGSLSLDYQTGDVDAWQNMAQPGTQTATITEAYIGEANCTLPSTGVYIYEVAYFKEHNSPCSIETPKHEYTITAYLPAFCDEIAAYADSVRVMGGFDNWSNGVYMQKIVDEDFKDCWVATIKDVEEGTEFKLRFGTDAEWKVQVRYNGENIGSETFGTTTNIVLQYDGEGYDFAACAAAPAVGDQFEDAASSLMFEITAVGEANAVKVIANNYTNYTGTSYTVPATVKYNDVDFAVTEIGNYAFASCSSLQSITIPTSVTTIGNTAFAASGLTSITIPTSVTSIGENAFGYCDGVTSVTFEGNACQGAIGNGAFNGVGNPDPALLTLNGIWTKENLPDDLGNWYGGKFELLNDPTALEKVDGGQCTMQGAKFMHNGRFFIVRGGKKINALGF